MPELATQTEIIDYRKINGEWYCFGQKLSDLNKNEPPEYLANLIQALEALESGHASQTLVVSDKYSLVNNFMKAPDGRIVNEAFSGSAELLNQLNVHNAESTLTNGVLSITNQQIPQQVIEQIATRQGLAVQFYSTEIPSDASLPSIDRTQEASNAELTANNLQDFKAATEKTPEVLAPTVKGSPTKPVPQKKESSPSPETVAKEQDAEQKSNSDSTNKLDPIPAEKETRSEQKTDTQTEASPPSLSSPRFSEIKEQTISAPTSTLPNDPTNQDRPTDRVAQIPAPQLVTLEIVEKIVATPIPVDHHQEHLVVTPSTPVSSIAEPQMQKEIPLIETSESRVVLTAQRLLIETADKMVATPTRIESQQENLGATPTSSVGNLAEPKINRETLPRETRDNKITDQITTASPARIISTSIVTQTVHIDPQNESVEIKQKTPQVTRQADPLSNKETRLHRIDQIINDPIKADQLKGIEVNDNPRKQISRETTNSLFRQEEINTIKDVKNQTELAQSNDLKPLPLATSDNLRETTTITNDQKDLNNISEQVKPGDQQDSQINTTPEGNPLELTKETTETTSQRRLVAEHLEHAHPQHIVSTLNLDNSRTDLELITSLSRLIEITASDVAGQETRRELAPQILELMKIIATDESPEAKNLIEILLVEFLQHDLTLKLSKEELPTDQLLQIIEETPEKLFLESVALIKEYFIQLELEENELAELLLPEDPPQPTPIELHTDQELKSEEDNQLPMELQIPKDIQQDEITIEFSTLDAEREVIIEKPEPDSLTVPVINELASLEEQILQTLLLLKEDSVLAQQLAQELLPVHSLRYLPVEDYPKFLASTQLVLQELLLAIEITELIQGLPNDQILSPTTSIGIQKEYDSGQLIELIGELQNLKKVFSEHPELLVKPELLSTKSSTNELTKTIQSLDAQIKLLQDLLITTRETDKLLTPNALTEIRLKRILQLNLLSALTKQDLWTEEQLVLFMQLLGLLQNTIEDPDEELELEVSQSAPKNTPRRIRRKLVRYLGKKLLLKRSTQSLPQETYLYD